MIRGGTIRSDMMRRAAAIRMGAIRTGAALLAAALILPAAACTPAGVAVGGGAMAGKAAMQERGFRTAIDDNVIAATVSADLFRHSTDLFARTTVAVHEGRVLLTGRVSTPDDRIQATRIAWQAADVREVINEIEVDDTRGVVDGARDSWISAQLRSKITFDRTIQAINYTIDTVNGTVYLLGIAQDQGERDRVAAYARDMAYVRRVVDHTRLLKETPEGGAR